MYYIGIDGGGTKTAFALFDENGICLEQLSLPTAHVLQVGFDGCATCLKQGIETLIANHQLLKKDVFIGMGIAGYGNDERIRHHLEQAIGEQLMGYHYVLTNDVHIALIGALEGQEGIMVIAGTGTIALAMVHGQMIRCGGWGYQLGDEGSGYWIGKQLLKYFTYQVDGRYPKDEVYLTIMTYFDITQPYQIISKISQLKNERTDIAALAKVCASLAKEHVYCQHILREAGRHSAQLVKTLQTHFDGIVKVSYYGGMFQNHFFKEAFTSALSNCEVIAPKHHALFGAYQLAKNSYKKS